MTKQELYKLDAEVYKNIDRIKCEQEEYLKGVEYGMELMFKAVKTALDKEEETTAKEAKPNGIKIVATVVEVVRCKDCIKRNTPDCAMRYECSRCGGQWSWESDYSYCSYGERREECKPKK